MVTYLSFNTNTSLSADHLVLTNLENRSFGHKIRAISFYVSTICAPMV